MMIAWGKSPTYASIWDAIRSGMTKIIHSRMTKIRTLMALRQWHKKMKSQRKSNDEKEANDKELAPEAAAEVVAELESERSNLDSKAVATFDDELEPETEAAVVAELESENSEASETAANANQEPKRAASAEIDAEQELHHLGLLAGHHLGLQLHHLGVLILDVLAFCSSLRLLQVRQVSLLKNACSCEASVSSQKCRRDTCLTLLKNACSLL
jgi:chemotaxis protein histidine kinase CheA